MVLGLGTLAFRLTQIDIGLARLFYTEERGWFLQKRPLLEAVYDWGILPSILLFAGSTVAWIWGTLSRKRVHWRRPALFLVLLYLVGPGLVTNSILKEHWNRPRPRETVGLGGTYDFVPVLSAPDAGNGESFPSGHAAAGFYLMGPYFLLRRSRKHLARAFLLGGTAAGLLMGLSRVVVGGHYPSDVLWAWGVTYGSGVLLTLCMGWRPNWAGGDAVHDPGVETADAHQ